MDPGTNLMEFPVGDWQTALRLATGNAASGCEGTVEKRFRDHGRGVLIALGRLKQKFFEFNELQSDTFGTPLASTTGRVFGPDSLAI